MLNIIKNLFSSGPKIDLGELIAQGATILDVRSKAEYDRGHVKGSMHIPLDGLERELARIPKDKPVITCCQSGMRSASAAQVLKDHGIEAHNGGPWTRVHALKK